MINFLNFLLIETEKSFELDNKTKQILKSKLTSKITHTNYDYLLTNQFDIELNLNDSRNEINPFKSKINQQTSYYSNYSDLLIRERNVEKDSVLIEF